MRRRRTVLKGIAAAIAVLVILAAIVTGSVAGLVRTSWGSELLRRVAESKLNDALKGKVRVKRLAVGRNDVTLEGVELWDPDGKPVARVGRLHAELSLRGLLHRQLLVSRLDIEAPTVTLVARESGPSNWARALEPRAPSAPSLSRASATSAGSGWTVRVGSLRLSNGAVEITRPGSATLAIARISVRAAADFIDHETKTLSLRLSANAAFERPIHETAAMELEATGGLVHSALTVYGRVSLGLGQSRMRARIRTDSLLLRPEASAGGFATVALEEIVMSPEQFSQFRASPAAQTPLHGTGTLDWSAATGGFGADLNFDATETHAAVKVVGGIRPLHVDDLFLKVRHIDLAQWLAGWPSSDLSVDISGRGSGDDLANLRGNLRVYVPRGRLGRAMVGPIRVTAQATPSKTLIQLSALLPGARLRGNGELHGPAMAVQMRLRADDLSVTSKALEAAGAQPPKLAGRGWARLDTDGIWPRLGLRMAAAFDELRFRGDWLRDVRLNASIPDVARPLFANATVGIPEGCIAGRPIRQLLLRMRSTGPRLSARLLLTEPERIRVAAEGRWQRGHRALVIERLDVGRDDEPWQLQRPTLVAWHSSILFVEDLSLRAADEQWLRLSLNVTDGALVGRMHLQGLRLEHLPATLLPRRLPIQGRLDADLEARGRWNNPRVRATAQIRQGMIANRFAVNASVDAHMEARRASGTLNVAALGGEVDGTFDLPLRWRRDAMLAGSLNLRSLAIEEMAAVASTSERVIPNVQGTLSATLDVRGTVSRPVVAVLARGDDVVVGSCSLGRLLLAVEGKPGTASSASLRVDPQVRAREKPCVQSIQVSARSDLGLAMLGRQPFANRRWMTAASRIDARIRGLDLGAVAPLVKLPPSYGGGADMTMSFEGSLTSPQLQTQVSVVGLRADGIPPTDGDLDIQLSRYQLTGHANVRRMGIPLLVLDARAHSPTSLLRRSTLGKAELRLHVAVGPLLLQHTSLALVSSRAESATLRGIARVVADVEGTLADPRANADVSVRDIQLGRKPWGEGHAAVRYAGGKLAVDASIDDRIGGSLRMHSTVAAGLGFPQILRPFVWKRHAISGSFEAKDLDLSALSAASPVWHDIGGKLSGQAAWSGSVSDPMPNGWMKIRDGAVTVTDVGQYKNIHLSLRGDQQRISIDELKLSSGDGTAKLVASGTHNLHGYSIEGRFDVDKLPVYANGQKLATVSVEGAVLADTSGGAVKTEANVKSARITMNDGKRKRLVEFARPADVVVVRGNNIAAREAAATDRGTLSGPPSAPVKAGVAPVVIVSAPRNLWLTGKDATIEVGLEPGFRVELAQPARIYGDVVVRRGRIDLLTRRFDLKSDSRIRFQGSVDAPVLDITAQHVNEQQHVTVVATVKGPPKYLTTSLTAPDRPELTESQLYTLIVTGRLALAEGPASSATPAGEAGSVLGGLLAGELQKVVAKELPFDVLTIEGGNTMGSAKVEAGTYVTPDVYVGYVGRLGADPTLLQNHNAVHLEYLLGSQWSLQGEYGDAKAGSADIFWTKHY